MDNVTVIRIVAGMMFLAVLVGVYIFFLLCLYKALGKCSSASRTMEPGLVWLMLVPFVNLVMQFLVVIALAKSLGNEFRARGKSNVEPEPGKSIGIAMCVCAVCGIVPLVNLLAFPAHLILLVIYWVKISGLSQALDQAPATDASGLYVPQYPQGDIPPLQPGTAQYPSTISPLPAGAPRPTPIYIWVIVGAVAFFFVCVPILMLIAIPTVGSLKKKANDLSALQSIRAVQQAEIQYSDTYPANGFACSLTALGGDSNSGVPSATSAQILQGDLASGFKSGYVFTLTCNDKVAVNGVDHLNNYSVTAVPQTVGKTGDRGFCSDKSGIIKFDPTGGANCTQAVGP
jgi:type IV pilus assembly protein PilA